MSDRPVRTLFSGSRTGTGYQVVFVTTVVVFTAVFVLPFLWLVLGAVKPAVELAKVPVTVLPETWNPGNYAEAWRLMDLGKYFLNTVYVVAGAWAVQILFDVPAAYALSKLRPVFGNGVLVAMLVTLMLPPSTLLVPMYLTITDVPVLGVNLVNNPAAIWLPAAANAFNIYLLKRFFDQIPSELLDAARMDGAVAVTVLWRVVLPMARPILAVVSILAVVAAWKDFIWPLLVFSDPALQTLSVALQRFAPDTPINLLLAGLVLAALPMIAVFLVFQRHILAGLTAGSVKG